MESYSVCNHTSDNKIGRPRSGSPICSPWVWIQTELDDTKSYYQLIIKISISEKRRIAKLWKKVNVCMSLWNWQQSKWICWLPSDERITNLLSVKNATMHENAHFLKAVLFKSFSKASLFISVSDYFGMDDMQTRIFKCASGFHAHNLHYSPTTLVWYHSVLSLR